MDARPSKHRTHFSSLPFPTQGTITVRPLDLADVSSVLAFARGVSKEEPRLDVLLNNAGVMACPELRTADGFEMQVGTNHHGHFLLTRELLPKLESCPEPPARVVCVASLAHTTPGSLDTGDLHWRARPYDRVRAYGASKLANVLHARGLAKRADPAKVLAFSLHPGVIQTDLFRHVGGQPGTWAGSALAAVGGAVRAIGSTILGRPLMKTVPQGAATSVYAATSPDLGAAQNGFYLADCGPCAPSAAGRDDALADALWAATEADVDAALAKRGLK
jgi:retinol dehydrogenase 12